MKRWKTALCFILFFFFLVGFGYGEEIQIRILYINDFHGFAEPYKPMGSEEILGGINYLAHKARQLSNERPSLLLAAGDMLQGNNWANFFQGASVMELMNEMGFDAMVVGNHEFDFGQAVLKRRISEAKFPFLGANVEGLDGLIPYVIKELKGIRIGIIGVVTGDTPTTTDPRNALGLHFSPPLQVVGKYVEELRNKTDIVMVLSHIGHSEDRVIAEKTKGLDVIVGGHSHTKVTKPVQVGDAIVVQAWEHAKALGVLDLTLRNGKIASFDGRLEEIKPKSSREDPRILAVVEKYKQGTAAVLNDKVGEAEADLDGERKNIRRRETNLGNFIADILKETAKADVAIINGGAIRASIKQGEVRVKDIYTVLPFDNYIVAIKLTGRKIREALEYGVSAIEEEEGRFTQVSGLTFTFLPTGKTGSRVKEISIDGRSLDMDKEYLVATNDFLAMGGDGFKAFGEAIKGANDFSVVGGTITGEKVIYSDSGKWIRDRVVEYIKEKRKIAPKVEGRIREVR